MSNLSKVVCLLRKLTIPRNITALQDITLEGRDCLLLWEQMNKQLSQAELDELKVDSPNAILPQVIVKSDVLRWESSLKTTLQQTMRIRDGAVFNKIRAGVADMSEQNVSRTETGGSQLRKSHVQDLFTLACDLHFQDALPALVFNYDRAECERAAAEVLDRLESAETDWKENSSDWTRKLADFEQWKIAKAKAPKNRLAKSAGQKGTDGDKASKLDMAKELGTTETSKWETFDPEAPQPLYSFADHSKLLRSEFEDVLRGLERGGKVEESLLRALGRGIGVHHAGMNRRYRQA